MWLEALILLCTILVLLPPNLDPAIKFKEWTERNRK